MVRDIRQNGERQSNSFPSRAILRGGVVYQNEPWDAVPADVGGLCRRLARSRIDSGLMALVAAECLIQPDHDPLLPDDHYGGIQEAE